MFRTAPGEARALIEDWIYRPALRELVEAFGGTWPEGDLEKVVVKLADWSKVWDYRSGQSRLLFHGDRAFEQGQADVVGRAAKQLGMTDPPPPSDFSYDYLIILGGLATAIEPRVKYGAEILKSAITVRRHVAGLTSYRELHPKEQPIADAYPGNQIYEIDLLAAAIAAHIGAEPCAPESYLADSRRRSNVVPMKKLTPQDTCTVVYAAASGQPDSRPANTIDTYKLFVESTRIKPGETALVVTSAIYAPYQHIDAISILGAADITVETVGIRDRQGQATPQNHRSRAYLQEVRSMLRSSRREVLANK